MQNPKPHSLLLYLFTFLVITNSFTIPTRPANATVLSSQATQSNSASSNVGVPCQRDDFGSSALASNWTWIDPLHDSSYSLTANPGTLHIQTATGNHDLYPPLPTNAPRIVQNLSGDFDVSTKVTIIPNNTFQAAGLLVWFSDTNFMWIGRSDSNSIQNRYYRDGTILDQPAISNITANTVYFRALRTANTLVTYYSLDEMNWTQTGSVDFPSVTAIASVGMFLINNWQDNPISADFDYFNCSGSSGSTDTSIPGGLWISPDHGFKVIENRLHFEARAYDNAGGSGIDRVNFTANVSGQWMIACTATSPSHDDVYGCDWSLVDSTGHYIPNGLFTVSFDVYDLAGNHNLAPNGTRQIEKQVPISDLGFLPNPNGYSFKNLAIAPAQNNIKAPELRAMFEQLFGSQNVRAPGGSPCYEAEMFFQHVYMPVANGGWSCFGLSATSLLSYLNWSQQRAGSYAMPHLDRLYDQPPSQSFLEHRDSVAYYSRVQLSSTTYEGWDDQKSTCKSNSNGPIARIKQAIQSQQPVLMSLWFSHGGHTIVPYRVVDISPIEANVYVYDNEDPGHEHLVNFKRLEAQSTWQWEYTFLGSLGGYPAQDGGCDTIFLYPLVRALEEAKPSFQICATPTPLSQGIGTAQTQHILTLLPPDGDGLLTNSVGQRLGWINGQAVSEIPGAYEIPQTQGSDELAYRALYLPESDYTVQVQNTSLTTLNTTLFGDGRMIQLDGQSEAVGTTITIHATSSLDNASISNLHSMSTFNLMFDNEKSDGSHFVTMRATNTTNIDNLDTRFDSNSLTLSHIQGALEFHLQFGHINEGSGLFISKELSIEPNATYNLKPADWTNLYNTTVILEIDRGSDGTVDETQILTNQVRHSYLPTVMRSASP
jgi:hypothetical protein